MYQICRFSRSPYGKRQVSWLHEHKGQRKWLRVRSGALQLPFDTAQALVYKFLDAPNLNCASYAIGEVGVRRPKY